MNRLFSNSWGVLGVLTGLALLMRFFSFFPSVIDHDESTYILIANSLLHGQVYLRDVFDTKPIGIFWLFALFQFLFGKSILVIRIISAIWIALTAWMIYRAHRLVLEENKMSGYNPAPVASGIIYVFITSIYTFYGVSPNTELFFNLFTISALVLILRYQQVFIFLIAGLLLGAGFMIKYVVLFDAIALGLFYLWLQVTKGKRWIYWFVRCVAMGLGFLVPFLAVWMYYRNLGLEEIFLFHSFELSGRYFIDSPLSSYLIYLLDGFARFLPVTFWFFFCVWHWRTLGPSLPLLGALWGGLVLIIILMPGKFFGHYFIQFMLPLSLLAGSFFDKRRSPSAALAWLRKPVIGYPILAAIIIANLIFQKKDYYDKVDYPREVAAYLNTRLEQNDVIYTANSHPITYHLTGTKSPTPYIHRSLHGDSENALALKVDPAAVWENLWKQNPRFVIIKAPLNEGNPLISVLETLYQPVKTFGPEIVVYERKK